MKFVQVADMHFDSPFTSLSDKGLGDRRRLEQREAFSKMIQYIKENKIPYLFIAGDLYEQEYIKQSTISYINQLFMTIPDTKIYIAPGNHDPYIPNSYYATFHWNENVHIFKSNMEKVETEDCIIYGTAFQDFYRLTSGVEEIIIEKKDKPNLLLMHGTLDGASTEDKQYCPIASRQLKEIGFDYVALGHMHKTNLQEENQNIVYPGSMISFGFDELGKHGMIIGDLQKEGCHVEFYPLDEREFVEKELVVDAIDSEEELMETIQQMKIEDKKQYKILLTGRRNFIVSPRKILSCISQEQILKIKDLTKPGVDLERLSKEDTLKGIFINKLLQEKGIIDEELIEEAIEIGLEALER